MPEAIDPALEAARNRILALVHLWMSIWDANKGDAAPLLDLLSPAGFRIVLEKEGQTLTTVDEVKTWFAGFAALVRSDNHLVTSVELSPLGPERWRAQIAITAPGIAASGQAFVAHSAHDWEVVDYGGLLPRVEVMTIRLTHPT
jgi:hypothetical protein